MQLKDLLNEYKCRMSVTNDYIAEHVGVNINGFTVDEG